MTQITAALVKELRDRTGAGMMDCKKALAAVEGDMDKAIDFLREKGLAAAAKKAGRIAAEGVVGSYVSEDKKSGVIVEVNCETDFVGKTDDFKAIVNSIAKHIAVTKPADMDALMASKLNGKTVAEIVTEAIAKIGENIAVRRFARYEAPGDGLVAAYIHAGGKIGVLVNMKGGSADLGKDIAMHIAATNPGYLDRTQVSAAEVEHEKQVLSEQARNEGKPEKIIEKMVLGRIQKYYKEVCLVEQEFVKDPDQTIGKLLKDNSAEVLEFTRFQMGEGIEKKQEDFAAEVMAQMNK
ncbi:MAG: translation elongation factor Ts [Phascolarctobacterium sp.]|nr:translation elongation factor Ts [Phascolarctobacterium sp.]